MEMVLQGVSTRKVAKVTEELCGASFSKSMVSELCKELQVRVDAWNERPLEEKEYPFLIVDAAVIKVRKEEKVRSVSALIVSGINAEGYREIIGMKLADSESEQTWKDLFRWLNDRGLHGVNYVVSDAHKGLVAAIQKSFQGAVWQRCQVHFMRNVFGHTPKRHQKAVSKGMKKILGADDYGDAREAFQDLTEELTGKADNALQVLEEGFEDALAVLGLPEKYRRRMKSTNMQERLIQEIRRRERVIRIFPNEASAMRLIGALLAEKHETWSTGKKYFDMTEYYEALDEEEDQNIAVEIPKVG
jgi:transposase-like protein